MSTELPADLRTTPAASTATHVPAPRSAPPAAESLRTLCGGAVHLPGDHGYDDARMPWNVAFDQRPAAVAYPATAEEVAEVLRAAAALGLRVAPQGTGHNPGPLGDLSGTVLLRTSGMTGVRVDPDAHRIRVGAGSLWLDVVEAAREHGLAVLHGSSPDVGVVGYCLGGGIGWYARQLGLAAHSITGAELVLPDGRIVRVDAQHEPDLLWALRGGGGNIGIVTELEIQAYDFSTAYAGMLVWDWQHASRVVPAWVEWARNAPDAVTTSLRLLQLPPLPELPEAFRGRQLVVIDGAVLAKNPADTAVLRPLRALAPELDTFDFVPVESLVRLHMDPEGPTPAVSDTLLLRSMPMEAIDAFLAVAGPGSGSRLLVAEIRQLGGALGRPAPYQAALSHLDGEFLAFGCGIAATPEMAAAALEDSGALVAAVKPWASGSQYLNFVERPSDVSVAYAAGAWERLRRIRRELDPTGVLHANHSIPVG